MNVRVSLRVVERRRTWDFRRSRNLKKIPEMLGIKRTYPASHPK